MTKKTLQLLATVAAVAGMSFAATTAHAAADSASSTTTAKVTLEAGSVDPEKPSAGGIELVSAPNLVFENVTLDGATTQTTKQTGAVDPVVIKNPGVASGWNVTVANTAFGTEADGAGDTIKAGTMTLTSTTPTTTNTDTTDTANTPTAQTVELPTEGTTAKPVASAALKAGVGTWNVNYSNAALTVPANNVAEAYTSNLTWTLTNAPA